MLSRSLEILKLKCLLHSRLMRDHLYDAIVHQKLPEYKAVFLEELAMTGGRQWRENEYDRIAGELQGKLQSDFPATLRSAFETFLCRDGMQIHARPECLEEYNALCRDLHPYALIAAWMAAELDSGALTPDNAERLSENLTEIALQHSHSLPFAENHCHEGGAANNNANLLFLAGPISWPPGKRTVPSQYRHSKGALLGHNEEIVLYRTLFVMLCEAIMERESQLVPDILADFRKRVRDFALPSPGVAFDRFFHSKYVFHKPDGKAQIILLKAFKQNKKQYFDSAILLFMTAFFLLLRQHKEREQLLLRYVLLFFHQMNRFRSAMTMHDGKGLTQFVKYYGSTWRKEPKKPKDTAIPSSRACHSVMRNILMGGTKAIEFRSCDSPSNLATAPLFQEIAKTLHKHHPAYSLHHTDPLWERIPHPAQCHVRFNYGYHFKKQKAPAKNGQEKSARESESRIRYQWEQEQVRKNYFDILEFLARDRYNMRLPRLFRKEFFTGAELLQLNGYSFDSRLLLRTLDAAGDENLAPPEIFAPFARSLRHCSIDLRQSWLNKKRRKLRLAFHAGEDFSCIVSGMRRVDETVRFMDYESGDRLGHALAIGMDPVEWLRRQQEIVLPKREYFDNCVWLAEMAMRFANQCSQALEWHVFYSEKAKTLIPQLYSGECRHFSVHDFYLAWTLRRNHPAYRHRRDPYFAPDYCDSSPGESLENAKIIHDEYLSPSAPCRKKEEQSVTLRHADFFVRSHASGADENIVAVTTREADFWCMVQDYQLQEYAMRGLILEANPSSNVYIGEINRYEHHPVFRWHPLRPGTPESERLHNRFGLRRGPIQICINSDDPAIFSTTLPNEFALLRNSLLGQRTYTQPEVDDWLERLRLNGMRIFEENYISPFYCHGEE